MNLKLFILKENLENVFHIQYETISPNVIEKVKQILSSNYKYEIRESTFLEHKNYIEIGPKKLFKTSWNTNVLDIFKKSNIFCISNIEFSVKYPKDTVPDYDKMIYEIYNEEEEIVFKPEIAKSFYVDSIENFNQEHNLGFDFDDISHYNELFSKLNRKPTNVELYDLSQSNSEHARHWFFKANFIKDIDNIIFMPLMDLIKSTKKNNKNGIISFYDNASVISGNQIDKLSLNKGKYDYKNNIVHFSYKAETHNFPTSICPFPGASTGVGGRIRDTVCVGKGGEILAGTAGYSVGEMDIEIAKKNEYDFVTNTPKRILIEASNGASDYGNKIGEPIIQGFTRSYRSDLLLHKNNFIKKRFEYLKPIMFSGGIGKILDQNIYKIPSKYNNLIGRVGGAAYRIGIGGGSASSRTQDKKNLNQDFDSVQRGDPEMANKVVKFVRTCCSLPNNPILSIHDQGSGGMANVTRELAEPNGANIILDNLYCGDTTLNTLEKWVAEYQEQVSFTFEKKHLPILEKIAERENVPFVVIGNINNDKKLKVISKDEDILPVDLPMIDDNKKKQFYLETNENRFIQIKENLRHLDLAVPASTKSIFENYLNKVLSHISVCSKSFLTNKVDRSVSGLIIRQQCVGPFQLPLANNAVVNLDFNSNKGLVSAIGEQPIKGVPNLYNTPEENIRKMVRMTVSEMLLNMVWSPIENITKINSVANWMWASKYSKDGNLLREAVLELVECVNYLGFSINGGKDSLSMTVDNITETIKSPNTLVLSGYSNCINFNQIITPNLKSNDSYLLYINLNNTFNLGGTVFEDIYHKTAKLTEINKFKICDVKNLANLKNIFILLQKYIKKDMILSGHDISDGGLITTLIEMSISSNIGFEVNYNDKKLSNFNFFFNEDPGVVIEVREKDVDYIFDNLLFNKIWCKKIGRTNLSKNIVLNFNKKNILNEKIDKLRYTWQKPSYDLELLQANPEVIKEEMKNCYSLMEPKFKIPNLVLNNLSSPFLQFDKPKVAIFNEEGSNGENEMAYCFLEVGFEVYNVNINDLISYKYNLKDFRGIAFVGGFSFSDVLGSAYGWYFSIINNKQVKEQFDEFYKREDTFSFGICNGCQLMSLLEWVPKGITLETNYSDRFESRYSTVRIENSNSIMLKDLDNVEFGIWTAHKQGRIVSDYSYNNSTFPIKYLDNEGNVTEKYPFNPNGSENGRCAIVSENGRHLAMMPHPERCVLKNQMPWLSKDISDKLKKYTPWILMFRNAYLWCVN